MNKEDKEEKLKLVHLLREKIGLCLLDCKHALIKNEWDIDKSIKYLINRDKSIRFTI